MQKACAEKKLDHIDATLEASSSTTLAKFSYQMGASVITMKYYKTVEFASIKTTTFHKLYNSDCDQK
jgi:hypothetical protein